MRHVNDTQSPAVRGDVALLIGRWQIHHNGHAALRKAAFAAAPRVIIVLGSAWHSRDPQNPFNIAERQQMIESVLSAEERARVTFLPIRDYYDNARWHVAVKAGVARLTQRADKIVLVGHRKDHTTAYLDDFAGWPLLEVEQNTQICATDLRRVYFESPLISALPVLSNYVEAGVLGYLEAWSKLPAYRYCAEQHKAVVEYRIQWPAPMYGTSDSLVRYGDKVLLIKRGGVIGRGLWALPGGFLNKREQFYPAAVRELEEETGLRLLASTMQQALKGQALFDHAARSPRGRLVSSVYYFDFGNAEEPELHANDDAEEYKFWPISELMSIESDLFEDHGPILDHFLGIFGQE